MKVISVGEVLWDVIEHKEFLGGAPFNFAAHLHRLGHTVFLVSGVGRDPRGQRVLQRMTELGLSSEYVSWVDNAPTGWVEVTLDQERQPRFTIHRPAAYDFPQLSDKQLQRLSSEPPDWIYFGTLLQMSPQAKRLTTSLIASNPSARRFYDVNLRAGSYEPALIRELMSLTTVVKLNEDEAHEIARMLHRQPSASLQEFCQSVARESHCAAVCVTRGARGCALLISQENGRDEYLEADGFAVDVADTVGAGDAFAAALLHGLDLHGRGTDWPAARIADFANRVGALVASRRGAVPDWTEKEVRSKKYEVRSRPDKEK